MILIGERSAGQRRNHRRYVVKEIMQKFAVSLGAKFWPETAVFRRLAFLICPAMLLLAGTARAQQAPLNDSFTNAFVISGGTGSTTGNDVGATLQPGEANTVTATDDGVVTVGESVWYQWTAPVSGNVTFDTLGSVDVNFNTMDTVLVASQGQTLATIKQVAANDNASAGTLNSSVTFFATAGLTYYVAIYVNAGNAGQPGNYVLNWNEQSAPLGGEFRLTSPSYTFSLKDNGSGPLEGHMRAIAAHATVTRVGGAQGMVDVAYQVAGGYYTNLLATNIYTSNIWVTVMYTNGDMSVSNEAFTIFNAIESYQNYLKLEPSNTTLKDWLNQNQ